MLAASIHEHAGLGNQIWRYVSCRVFAENHGYDFGVSHPGWRGKFLNIDWGKDVPINIEQDSDFNLNCGFTYCKEKWINHACLLYTSPSPRDGLLSRMPSSA